MAKRISFKAPSVPRRRISEYAIWSAAKQRCGNPNHDSYKHYGGRGIFMSPSWQNSFERFYADMGPRPSPQHTLDRINNDAGYCVENCRWATRYEQARNKRNNTKLTMNGVTRTIGEWAETLGVNRTTLSMRLTKLGWTPEDALTVAVHPHHWHKGVPSRRAA